MGRVTYDDRDPQTVSRLSGSGRRPRVRGMQALSCAARTFVAVGSSNPFRIGPNVSLGAMDQYSTCGRSNWRSRERRRQVITKDWTYSETMETNGTTTRSCRGRCRIGAGAEMFGADVIVQKSGTTSWGGRRGHPVSLPCRPMASGLIQSPVAMVVQRLLRAPIIWEVLVSRPVSSRKTLT